MTSTNNTPQDARTACEQLNASDTVCECGHWIEEHNGTCHAPECSCESFTFDAINTAEGLAMWQDAR